MVKLNIVIVIMGLLGGCVSPGPQTAKSDHLAIQDGQYPTDSLGRVVLTASQLERLKQQNDVTYIANIVDDVLVVDYEEYVNLTHDPDLLYSLVPEGNSATYLEYKLVEGSLKHNVQRMAERYGWTVLSWELPFDYYIPGESVAQGDGFLGLLASVIADYPIYFNAELEESAVSILYKED